MILKTYTRLFSHDIDASLAVLGPLHAGQPHLRFRFGEWELVGLGDILIVAGTEESLRPIRHTMGPWVVDDIEATKATLIACGADITQDIAPSETGRFLYARHLDGAVVEYVQWLPDLVERFITKPASEGRLASQL